MEDIRRIEQETKEELDKVGTTIHTNSTICIPVCILYMYVCMFDMYIQYVCICVHVHALHMCILVCVCVSQCVRLDAHNFMIGELTALTEINSVKINQIDLKSMSYIQPNLT